MSGSGPLAAGQIKLRTGIAGPIAAGLTIAFLGFGGLAAWTVVGQLESGALAQGVVAPRSGRKVVQHLEGGIIAELAVRDGTVVKAGDLLVRLDGTQARAAADLLRGRRLVALATLARLEAERDNLDAPRFPADLAAAGDPSILASQKAIFESRRTSIEGQVAILKRRRAEQETEIEGMQAGTSSSRRQLELVRGQIANLSPLLEKGLVRLPQILALQQREAEIEGTLGRLTSDIARARQRIREIDNQITQVANEFQERIAADIKTARTELSDAEERIRSSEDILGRTAIVSPADGIVTNLRFRTIGGVVPAGQPILDLVPQDDVLVIDARIRPEDIDVVRPGLPVIMRASALSRRKTKPLHGEVLEVSPDRSLDSSGRPYFGAIISITASGAGSDPLPQLSPGMPAEVQIVTGSKAVIDYLLDPILSSFERAMTEQ
jgi:HlyD family type I secretion membrane fusion protein